MADVLFVDDESSIVRFFERFAQRMGVDAIAFTDPLAALEWLTEHAADVRVVVSDLRMDPISGLEVLARLPPQFGARFILLTGDLGGSDLAAVPNIATVMQKPVRPRDLIREIQRQMALAVESDSSTSAR